MTIVESRAHITGLQPFQGSRGCMRTRSCNSHHGHGGSAWESPSPSHPCQCDPCPFFPNTDSESRLSESLSLSLWHSGWIKVCSESSLDHDCTLCMHRMLPRLLPYVPNGCCSLCPHCCLQPVSVRHRHCCTAQQSRCHRRRRNLGCWDVGWTTEKCILTSTVSFATALQVTEIARSYVSYMTSKYLS